MTISNGRTWRYAFTSALGSSHLKSGIPCQDSSECAIQDHGDESYLVAVVADGAGSAKYSQYGSRLACHLIHESVQPLIEQGLGLDQVDREFAEELIKRFQVMVKRIARRTNNKPRDFACTVLAALIAPDRAAFFQIGDGAIVVSRATPPEDVSEKGETSYDWVFWPQNGEYANETVFATGDNACEDMQFAICHENIDEVAVFSDGIQNLVLDNKNRVAHSSFFEPMFGAVRKEGLGYSETLSQSLERYLNSRSILSRTDDDKSLVLATRRHPQPPAALPSLGGDPFGVRAAAPSTMSHTSEGDDASETLDTSAQPDEGQAAR